MYLENLQSSPFVPMTPTPTKWNRFEDKLFEHALVMFSDDLPDRWEKIASQVPGKSPEDVRIHYDALVHDVRVIDSGRISLPKYDDDLSDWDSASQISFGSEEHSSRNSTSRQNEPERKKGSPWTQEEHK